MYAINWLIHLRKWYILKSIHQNLADKKTPFSFVDAGCGEAQYLFPFAKRYKQSNFIGIDKNSENIKFCNRYINFNKLNNCKIIDANIENEIAAENVDFILCATVLQYVQNDEKALQNFYNLSKQNGKLILYVPINGKFITKVYKYLFYKYENYETVQNRQRVYTVAQIEQKLCIAGFGNINKTFTYGYFGLLSNEILNCLFILISNFNFFIKVLACFILILLFPIIFTLNFIDFFSVKKDGNGLLIVAEKL